MLHHGLFGFAGGWLICGVLGAWIATSKGRGGCFWFLLCAWLGPIGLILAAVLPARNRN
jgi:hypothetical protein